MQKTSIFTGTMYKYEYECLYRKRIVIVQKSILSLFVTAAVLYFTLCFHTSAATITTEDEDRDLYIFVINGDTKTEELDQFSMPCFADRANCSSSKGYIKKSFSRTILQKAIDFSRQCTPCDVLIDYTKFEKIKK